MTTRTTTLRLRHPDDVLAAVPYVLGFHPHESLVMLCTGAPGQAPHVRVDLGDGPDGHVAAARALHRAAVGHGVESVVLVAYSTDAERAEEGLLVTLDALERDGVRVALALRADGQRWVDLHAPAGTDAGEGVAYDVTAHPISAGAVVEGRAAFASRDELAASLHGGEPDDLAAVARVVEEWTRRASEGGLAHVRAQARWVRDDLPPLLEEGAVPRAELSPEHAGRLLAAIAVIAVRDVAWGLVTQADSARHLALWRELVRRSPACTRAPAAALLAFTAWRRGEGALAWCAVDVCLEHDRDYTLGLLVARCLEDAVPPSVWTDLEVDALPVLRPRHG